MKKFAESVTPWNVVLEVGVDVAGVFIKMPDEKG
jgi:hypothetical protein